MADKIKLLPEPVANQIAAGEVVNRPSSVVKELLENALDAGGRNVTVNFRDGGKGLIQVVDDGCGMSEIDARLAFDRHATSKISDVEDIYKLGTFGFRGEALASIASVAEVELRTRQHDRELGTKVEIRGGKFISQEPVSCPEGSQFLIKNLFYNVPARRRFLDKSSTESRHIVTEFQRVALCNPDIAMSLYDSDSLVLKLPPSGLRQRVIGVIGKNIGKNLLDVSAETSIVRITGFAGRPAGAKQTNKEQFLFVNGRFFKSAYFHKAVVSAYDKLIPPNTQPSYFLYLEIDPERIDVNVHPQKTEVKFADGSDMWQIINAAVRESLAKSGAVPPMDFDLDTSVEIPVLREGVMYREPEIQANPDFNPFERYKDAPDPGKRADISDFMRDYEAADYRNTASASSPDYDQSIHMPGFESGCLEDDYESSVLEFIEGEDARQARLDIAAEVGERPVLPIGSRHFAASDGRNLIVVDILRAHEAVLYNRYMLMLGNESSVSQQLLFPEKMVLSSDDHSLLKEHMADFAAFGFDISASDGNTIEILGLPADFSSSPAEQLVYDLLDELHACGEVDKASRLRRLAGRMATAGAVKRSGRMHTDALQALFAELMESGNTGFTPSGARVMATLSEEQLRKLLQ